MKPQLRWAVIQTAVRALAGSAIFFAGFVLFLFLSGNNDVIERGISRYDIRLFPVDEAPAGNAVVRQIDIHVRSKTVYSIPDLDQSVRFLEAESGNRLFDIPVSGLRTYTIPATDINSDGRAEVVLETFSGGAHCCYEYRILRLKGRHIELLKKVRGGNASLEIKDLDGDGKFELITADDCFAHWHGPYAGSPMPRIVYEWRGGRYVLANNKYIDESQRTETKGKEDLLKKIGQRNNASIEYARLDFDDDKEVPTLLLDVMLDHIYIGEWKTALSIFNEYPMAGATRRVFISDFLETLENSRDWDDLLLMAPDLKLLSIFMRPLGR